MDYHHMFCIIDVSGFCHGFPSMPILIVFFLLCAVWHV